MGTVVSTHDAPQAIEPYSQAIKAHGLIFVSGQIPLDPTTQQMITGSVAQQTERVLQNIAGILQAAASSLEKVVRCAVFLQSLEDVAAMNAVYATFFPAHPPARSTVEVARLPQDCLVEIDAIALA